MTTYTVNIKPSTDIFSKFRKVRNQTIQICSPLKAEDFVVQPMTDVSPPKWHLGHTTWFFENFILKHHLPEYQLFDERLNYIFNSYYESQGPRILRSNRGNLTRPTVEEVMQYRQHVDKKMEELSERFSNTALPDDLEFLIETGLQHEQQHQELLLTDLKYILGNNPLFPVYAEKRLTETPNGSHKSEFFIPISSGIYEIGYEGDGFCWDNELKLHKVYLQPFEISDRLVTNREYLEFMAAGGYKKFQYWLGEGWEMINEENIESPLYWFFKDNEWFHYTLSGFEKVNPDEPVTHISYYEADAYARWRGMRLPTEFEWEVACKLLHSDIPSNGNFVENNMFHPIPQISKADNQFLGNVWEWTGSAYLPYPGYEAFEGALGEYNGKFMINQMVLRGGSCATPRSHIRMSYRNFFHPDKRWQFTGIRLAK